VSAFYIGQRVRVICKDSVLYGHTGHIYDILRNNLTAADGTDYAKNVIVHRVDIDGKGKIDTEYTGLPYGFAADEIAPIDDDRHTPADQEFCEWFHKQIGRVSA